MPLFGAFGAGSLRGFGFSKITDLVPAISISLVSYVTADDTTSITMPSGIQNGDIGVLYDAYAQVSEVALVIPTSWTSLSQTQTIIGSGTSSRYGQAISYRILTSLLSGSSVTGINTNAGSVTKVLYIFRPASAVTTVTISTPDIKSTVPPILPTTSIILGGQVHIAGWRTAAGTTAVRSFTPTDDQAISVNISSAYSTAIMPGGSSTATLTSITGSASYAVQTCFSLSFV